MVKKMFLVDGSALYYRSYFALIRNPLINSKGENTSATFGFLSALLKLIEDERPEYLVVVFDTKEPTFRHELYDEYKATREKMPEEMSAQYPRLIDTLKAFRFNLLELDGYEADDIIGTLAVQHESEDLHIFIVSGDKDMAQLVNQHIFLYTPGKSNQLPDILDKEAVKKKYGVAPEQIVDWLALMGDSSDNIPGAHKVGKVTASKLLAQFGNIENIFADLEKVKSDALRKNLEDFQNQWPLSKQLTQIDTNAPLKPELEELQFKLWDMDVVDPILKDLEFRRFYDKMLEIYRRISGEAPLKDNGADKKALNYTLVRSENELDKLVNSILENKWCVFDLETDSLDIHTAKIAGMAFAWQEGTAYYVPVNHPDSELPEDMVLPLFKPLFENPEIGKEGQNIKYDAAVLRHNGINVKGITFDTMIASYLIDPSGRQHNLDRLAREYLDHDMIPIEEVIGSGKKQKVMTELAAEEVLEYAAEDADITLRLKNIFLEKLKENDLYDLFQQIEMPLLEVLMVMEDNGIRLDTDLLKRLSERLAADLEGIEREIFKQAGREFNISSPQQLGRLLFDELEIHQQIDKRKPRKTKTGQYSTSEMVLERYREHPLINNILSFRRLSKLKNTYIDALPELVSPVTGKVHTSFNQTVAATGRLSSSNPNLQNIPIRTELGREIRKAFIASEKDYSILSADYSQIELRIMAHLSGDKKLIEAFNNNLDIHASTASLIFGLPIEEVEPDQRRKAKEINFGIMYGMNEYGLSNRLELSVEEARTFIGEYFATYPAIRQYMADTVQKANDLGYVETMLKRRRYLPEIKSKNRSVREFAERTAINTPIQGSAADLIKRAMIAIHQFMLENTYGARMLLQVHDELVFEVPDNVIDEFSKNIKDIMENALPLNVPVLVDTGRGSNWLEAH